MTNFVELEGVHQKYFCATCRDSLILPASLWHFGREVATPDKSPQVPFLEAYLCCTADWVCGAAQLQLELSALSLAVVDV